LVRVERTRGRPGWCDMTVSSGIAVRADLVRERLGRPEYQALFSAVRERMEEGGPELVRTVTLNGLTLSQRQALADLHGWRELPAERVRLSLAKLDAVLRESVLGVGLVDAVVMLGGPLADRRAARDAVLVEREELWSRAAKHLSILEKPVLAGWIEELRALGLVARAARASGVTEGRLLEQALAIAHRLPAGGVQLSVLASELTGDAHALDPGQPLAALVIRAAARLAGRLEVPASAAVRRKLWAEVGVICDPLSAQVLTLGLRPLGEELLPRHLRELSGDGEPRRITLRELARSPPRVEPGTDVFVCENPSVVAAAADAHQGRCAAIVCLEGVPSTAALMLLRAVRSVGARILFHADFDWAGIRIGNLLTAQLDGVAPWRFAAAEYERAAASMPEGMRLNGTVVESSWDLALAEAMQRLGLAVFEEQVLGDLLADLERR